jgi:two-component system, OmpR family, sensor kinase
VFFVCLILVMVAVVHFAIGRADQFIERVSLTHRQLETITELSLRANRYSEQIAEMLLFGKVGVAEFEEARRDLEASFADLERTTRTEIASLEDQAQQAIERRELALIEQMGTIASRMYDTSLELLEIVVDGRQDAARQRYFAEIEEDLDDHLQQLIDLAIAEEQAEVSSVDRETATLAGELIAIVATTTVIAILASVGAVLLLSRALSQPIARLAEGAAEIGDGRLSHRIAVHGRDELALLSNQFNRMAEQLEIHRSELLQQHELLERKVRERTQQLEEANRRLEDLDRLRIQFLADVSHELRTPLAVLRGEAEVTLRSRANSADDYRDTLGQIVEQAEHMARLVDDLLFVTRAEADSIRFEMRRLDLRQILDQAVEDGRMLALERGLEVAVRRPAEPVPVWGDGQRLYQTLLIAIDNAVKYAHPQTTVDVALDAADGQSSILVRNRGLGVPTEDLPYVFDRFYRGRHNASLPGGSGLGLSIAKWIVEKHGGTIALLSKPGGVTELEIHLPETSGNAGPGASRALASPAL